MRGYEKGETVFSEGEPAERIHFLFVGKVKIVKAGPGRDLILEILGPGEPVGAVAAFEGRPFRQGSGDQPRRARRNWRVAGSTARPIARS